MGLSIVIFIVFIIVIAIILLWARRALNKQKGIFDQFMASGQAEEDRGNDSQAVAFYKQALAVVLGTAQGSVELTAKGVGMMLQQSGRTAVDRLNAIYARHALQPSWEEFNALVAEFQKMSTNTDLVDRYGVPKGEAKQMFALLQEKLKRCIEALPGLEAAAAPAPLPPVGAAIPPAGSSLPAAEASAPPPLPPAGAAIPPAFPSYPASATPAPAYTIPVAEEVAARNRAARKRNTIIIVSVVGGAVLLCGLIVILAITGLLSSGGVLHNIQTVISTTTP